MKTLITLIFTLIIIVSWIYVYLKNEISSYIKVKNITVASDIDNDWIDDINDILDWARNEIKNKTNYKSAYYSWWYPPKNEWVCTDVIWRAFKNSWIDLKKLIDKDISDNISNYDRVNLKPDPNIDFRRVPNLNVFLKNNSISLTTKIISWDIKNLEKWQPWDIVVFWEPNNHVAIVSDKRDKNWVPYMIHNSAPTPREDNWIIYWNENISPIIGHYRWKY